METEIVSRIESRFRELGVEVAREEIESRVAKLVREFKVPPEEAERSVVNYFLKERGIPQTNYYQLNPALKVKDITEAGVWGDLKAKVVQLWEPTHESIDQVGLVGDETGTIKFTKWKVSGLPALEEGRVYLFKNLVTDKWQDRCSVKLTRNTRITPLEEDIEVNRDAGVFTGVLVDIQSGSGLIKRCRECNRALTRGVCGEHGKVEGEYDLRIKGVLDNGETTQQILLNREMTEHTAGITMEEAKTMASESLDPTIVLDKIKARLIGRYYRVQGGPVDRYILVNTMERLTFQPEEIESLLETLEALPQYREEGYQEEGQEEGENEEEPMEEEYYGAEDF